MKKFLILILVLAITLSLASCKDEQGSQPGASNPNNAKAETIAIVADTKTADIEFLRSSFIASGFKVDLRYEPTAEGQNTAIVESLKTKPLFLVLKPDRKSVV